MHGVGGIAADPFVARRVKSTLFALVQQFEFRQPEGMRMYKWNM